MREVELGWGKVLLVKDNGEFHALGHKCPHYGAPLVKGKPSGVHGAGWDLLQWGCAITRHAWPLLPGISGPCLLVGSPELRGRASGARTQGSLERGYCWWPSLALPLPGVLSRGRVRCPWHGACFNISTGDLEDFPGLDSLHKFQVRLGVQWGGSLWVLGQGPEHPKAWS